MSQPASRRIEFEALIKFNEQLLDSPSKAAGNLNHVEGISGESEQKVDGPLPEQPNTSKDENRAG